MKTQFKPRLHMDKIDCPNYGCSAALYDSIKELGLMNPITVRKKRTRYAVVDGVWRYNAMKMLGQKTIPAIVLTGTHYRELLNEMRAL